MNTNTILQRSLLPETTPDQLVTKSVLEYAESKLGYKHPERDSKLVTGELAQALRVMGLKPFTPESVAHYKNSKTGMSLRKYWERTCEKINGFFNDGFGMVLLVITFIVAVVSFIALAFHCLIPLFIGQNLSWSYCFDYWGAYILIPILAAIGLVCALCPTTKTSASWIKVSLNGYSSPVPEFALATAMEIHQRVPHVEIFIDELIVQRTNWPARQEDPFLVAKLYSEEFYVEVWAEPGYKQERMA